MRYYLGQLEYKWTHAHTELEHVWIRQTTGDTVYNTVANNNWEWVLLRTRSQSLPPDIYCRTLVYADSQNDKRDTHFQLKFPNIKPVEREASAIDLKAAKR